MNCYLVTHRVIAVNGWFVIWIMLPEMYFQGGMGMDEGLFYLLKTRKNSLCCMIAEKPVYLLKLTEEDMQNVIFFFESNSIEQIEIKLKHLTAILIKQLFSHRSSDAGTDTPDLDDDITETIAYLQSAAHNYAARICHLDVAGQMVF